MIARKGLFSGIGRSAAMATVVAVVLTTVGPVSAFAGSARKGLSTATLADGITDVSARRRVHRGGGAAAAAVFAGIVGTGLAIAASQNRRDYYDSYDAAPGYYGGGPVYYGGGPGYYGRDRSTLPYVNPRRGW